MWNSIVPIVAYGLAILFASLIALLVLDSTVGYWLLKRTPTFIPTLLKGENKNSGRLLVHLPGILFDGLEGVEDIKDSLLKHVSEGLFISYGYWRFLPDEVIAQTAAAIGPPTADRNKLDIIGTSFGGKLGADLIMTLESEYGWATGMIKFKTQRAEIKQTSSIRLSMVDTPISRKVFASGGDKLSLILSKLHVGPLVSLVASYILPRHYVLPFDYNIEDGRMNDDVRLIAKTRMSRFMLSMICDQQRYLSDENLEPLMGTIGVFVTYLMCIRNNVTIVQPFAVDEVRNTVAEHTENFEVIEVESPHCAYLERSGIWNETFDKHLANFPKRIAA